MDKSDKLEAPATGSSSLSRPGNSRLQRSRSLPSVVEFFRRDARVQVRPRPASFTADDAAVFTHTVRNILKTGAVSKADEKRLSSARLSTARGSRLFEQELRRASRTSLGPLVVEEEDFSSSDFSDSDTDPLSEDGGAVGKYFRASQRRSSGSARARFRYHSARDLYRRLSREGDRGFSVFARFVRSRGNEFSLVWPILQMLVDINALETTSSDDESFARGVRVIRDRYLFIDTELKEGKALLRGAYGLAGSPEFFEVVDEISAVSVRDRVHRGVFRQLKKISFKYLDNLYFNSRSSARSHCHFHESVIFTELYADSSELAKLPKAKRKDKKRLKTWLKGWAGTNQKWGGSMILRARGQEEVRMLALLQPRLRLRTEDDLLEVDWANYKREKAHQVVHAMTHDPSALYIAQKRLERVRRDLYLHCTEKGPGRQSYALLEDIDKLLQGPHGMIDSKEFLKDWHEAIADSSRELLTTFVFGPLFIPELEGLLAENECSRLQERCELVIEDLLFCKSARLVLDPRSKADDAIRTAVLNRVAQLMTLRGDHEALSTLRFLSNVLEYHEVGRKERASMAKQLMEQYLRVSSEVERGAVCRSGLYHLRGPVLSKQVALIEEALTNEKELPPELFDEVYTLAFRSLRSRGNWLSTTPPYLPREPLCSRSLPSSTKKQRHEARHLTTMLAKSRRAVLPSCALSKLSDQLAKVLVLPEHVEKMSRIRKFIKAKTNQSLSALFTSYREDLVKLDHLLARQEQLILRESHSKGYSGALERRLMKALTVLRTCLGGHGERSGTGLLAFAKKLSVVRKDPELGPVIEEGVFGQPLLLWLDSVTGEGATDRLARQAQALAEERVIDHMVRWSVSVRPSVPVSRFVVSRWERFLHANGDAASVHGTRFLLRVAKLRSLSKKKRKEEAGRICREFLLKDEKPREGSSLFASTASYFLRHLLLRDGCGVELQAVSEGVRQPKSDLTDLCLTLGERVSDRLWRTYPDGSYCCVGLQSERDMPVLDREMKGFRATMRRKLRMALGPAPKLWHRRLCEEVLPLAGAFRTEEIMELLTKHHSALGLSHLLNQRLAQSLQVVERVGEEQGGLTPLLGTLQARLRSLLKLKGAEQVRSLLGERSTPRGGPLSPRRREHSPSHVVDALIGEIIVGEDLREGLSVVSRDSALHGSIEQLSEVGGAAKGVTHLPLEGDVLESLRSRLARVPLDEITRTLVQHGSFNPELVEVATVRGGSQWRLSGEDFAKACSGDSACEEPSERIALFYKKLFQAIRSIGFYPVSKELTLNKQVKEFLLRSGDETAGRDVADMRPALPWVDALIATTLGPWNAIEGVCRLRYKKLFKRGWDAPIQTQNDKEARAEMRFLFDEEAGRVTVEAKRPYVVARKPVKKNPPEKVLQRFTITARFVFDKEGRLLEAKALCSHFQLWEPWHDLPLSLELCAEQRKVAGASK